MAKIALLPEGRVKIHLLKSILWSPLWSVVFYFFVMTVFRKTLLYSYMCERQGMPYICTVMFFIAIMMLYYRWKEFNLDYKAIFALEANLTTVGKITSDNAEQILENVKKDDKLFVKSELASSRITRLMRHVKSGSSWSETESLVKGMGSKDMEVIESAYVWIKFIIWILPILGFVGTVLGLGASIGGFNAVLTGTKDFAAMKGSLGAITDSLAYAFDSTLVALVLDIGIVFLLAVIQKQGDDLMVKLDEVITDDVLVRIEHIEPSKGGEALPLTPEAIEVLDRFSKSTGNLENLAKLDSFEKTFFEIKNTLQELKPILSQMSKKRALHLKLEEVEEN